MVFLQGNKAGIMATRNRSGKSLDSSRGGGHTTALLSLNGICRLSFAAGGWELRRECNSQWWLMVMKLPVMKFPFYGTVRTFKGETSGIY